MCLAGNEGRMFPLRITTSSRHKLSWQTHTHTLGRYQHSSYRSIPLVQAGVEQSRTQCHDLKFDTKRMFSSVLGKYAEVGCHAKQSLEGKDFFQIFSMHQAIKMTFVCRLLALVSEHIANTWNYMFIHDLNSLGILPIKEKQTLRDLCRPCGKSKGKKQAIGQSRLCNAALTSMLIL